jgi:serine protease Do
MQRFSRLFFALLGSILIFMVTLGWQPAQAALAVTPIPADTNIVTEVVDQVRSAVVQVNVSRDVGNRVFNPFFGARPPATPTLQGLGSGFVIDSNGLILTNAHVVEQADRVTVSFQDGRLLKGQVLGKDPITDIAVIAVDATNLPTVKIGDSDNVRQGQWAIAIGNPLGLQETVTVGVISATHRFSRDIGIPDKRIGFLQTDAAINPGNSGGPLLNTQGEVIGVNTAIIGGTQGLGFAIPINTAQGIAQRLIADGQVEHPYIGIEMISLTPRIKERLEQTTGETIESDRGLLVARVNRNSPAAQAGVRPGDIIQAVDGKPILQAEVLQKTLDRHGVGNSLDLTIQRRGQLKDISVEPQPLPMENRGTRSPLG